MENNNVTTRKKTKQLIILLAAFFVLCGIGLGCVFAWKNWKEQEVAEQTEQESDETVVNEELVLDVEGMPEDGSDITDIKQASDSKTLRKLLKSAGKFAIELTEDVRVEEELIVNGTKKLVGNKSITMELYAQPFQSVLSVAKGATLILDGVTIDGNGIANGVTVQKDAGFTGLSGKVVYPVPYGIAVAGKAKLNGISIEKSQDIGLCLQEGGIARLNGGKIIESNQSNVHIQATAQLSISGNTVLVGSHYGIRNRGTCVMTGGTVRDVSGYFVYNSGELTVDYTGKNVDDRLEWSGAKGEAGIRVGAGSSTYVQGVYIHDIKNVGIAGYNQNKLEIENCVIQDTGNYGFSTYNGREEVILKNVQILDTKASAVRANKNVKVTLIDLTVKNTTGFGIKNENNLIVAKNVVIENSENTGIWGNIGSETQVDGATIMKPGKFGIENNSAKMTLKNVTVTDPKRMGYVGKKESITEIEKMTIENAPERGIYNLGGKVTASDVTVLSAGTYGVSTAKSGGFAGSLKITNLTVKGVGEKDAVNCYDSVLEVTNGSISDAKRYGAIASKGGKLKLTDVTITACGERGVISSGSEVALKNVQVTKCEKFGVTVNKTTEHQGILTAENLTIADINGNALNNNGSVMTVTKCKISDVKGNGVYAEKSAQLTLVDVEMNDCQKRGAYVNTLSKASLNDIRITNAGQSSIFQEVGTQVEAKDIIVKSSGSYGIFVKSAMFTGQKVTVLDSKENGVHISSSEKEGQSLVEVDTLEVKNVGARGVYNLGGKVTLVNATITNCGTFGATSAITGNYIGELNIANLTLTGVKGNALNCNGSVLTVKKGTVSDVKSNGAYVENGGQLTLTKVDIQDCEKRGVYVNSAGTKAVITDTKFTNTGESGIFLEQGSSVEAKGMVVEAPGSYGVFVKSATLNAEDVTVRGSVANSLHVSSAAETGQSVVTVKGLTIENAGDRGIFNEGGETTLSAVTITNPNTYGATTTKKDEFVGKLDITGLTIAGVKKNNALNCNGSVLNVTTGTISTVKQNGVYVETGGAISLTGVEITGCERRGLYVNGIGSKAVVENVKVSDTVMTNVRIKDAELLATDLVVVMNDQIGQNVDEEGFYGICMVGEASNVTISGEKSTVTRTAAADVIPANSAIWIDKGTFTINNGVYSGLRAQKGGVMYNNGGTITINKGTFENNQASGHGGVLFIEKGTATINNGNFQNNLAGDRGGVILAKGNLTINGGEFANNEAKGKIGGGVIGSTSGTTLNVTGGYFHDNKATSTAAKDEVYGGGAIESAGSVVISNGTFESNTAQKGGALYIDKAGSLSITGGAFGSEGKGNVASYRGGAICIHDRDRAPTDANVTIQGVTFNYNKSTNKAAVSGGVVYVGTKSKVAINSCTFANNMAEYTGTSASTYSYGGCIYLEGTTTDVTVTNTTFTSNEASIGGAILAANGTVKVDGCTFSSNKAKTSGLDIRGNNAAVIQLSGTVISEVALNGTAKISVQSALNPNSKIYIRIINASSITATKTRAVVEFADGLMNDASRTIFAMCSVQASTYNMTFADNKLTLSKQ